MVDRAREVSRVSENGEARYRLELVPIEGVEEQANHLPKGAKVTITCLGRGIENSLRLTGRLIEQGLRAVPHIPARLVSSEEHLQEIVQRLGELSVKEIFVIGGDARKPSGPFSSAFELLSAMAEQGHGFERVGIGGYPEGHPAIGDDALLRALLDKQPFATYIVTQMCFRPEAIVEWVAGIRRQGVRLPVVVGIPGIVEKTRLLRISRKIGVGGSARFLRKHGGLAGRFLRFGNYRPDELVGELVPYVGDPDYSIAGFHIYTFNQVESTEKWCRWMLDKEPAEAVGQ